MSIDIRLPALGDSIESGDVLEIKVREGDLIAKDQGIVELETDKATVEVPSTHAGKVVKVHVVEGQTVKINATLITLEEVSVPAPKGSVGSPPKSTAATAAKPAAPPAIPQPIPQPAPQPPTAQPVLAAIPSTAMKPKPVPTAPSAELPRAAESSSGETIAAGPAVRRFAREVGVQLSQLSGTGPGGRITREDVLAVVRAASETARTRREAPSKEAPRKDTSGQDTSRQDTPASEATESDSWGPVRYEKMSKIRKTIAAKMHESWSNIPRVTHFDDADVTELEHIRQSSKKDYAANGIKLTSLPFVVKSVAMSLKKHPVVNAAIDMEHERIIYKNYVNVGIAVDTDRGLVVPSLRGADKLSISEMARQLGAISEKVRTGEFKVEDLRGGTFTISNLGAIGGTYSTPIIHFPEVAILLVGRARPMPVVVNDQVVIRLMLPLSLSYDHRLVDGAAAARFLNDVISYLEAPSRLLLAP